MPQQSLPSRSRVISSNAHKYIGKNVAVLGEVISMTPHANTLTLRLTDDETLIVLLQKNSTKIEQNLLTEVTGKLVSRGQVESLNIKQYDHKQSALINKSLYNEAAQIYDAHRHYYDI